MAWNERLRAVWRGEVSSADVAAMFAATGRLSTLQQSLADARLAADIQHTGHEWRAPLAVGPIAAPLWLADALVGLASAFYDAETQPHAARLTPYTHDLVAALLAPVEELIVAVTAAVADPTRHVVLDAPVRVGPEGDIAGAAPPRPAPLLYLRGLATGATRVHTSAAAALAPLRATFERATPPDWLAAGAQRQDGILQAAGARLEMAQVRLDGMASAPTGDPTALDAICHDLWAVVEAAMRAGQLLVDPHLMPEAAAAPRPAPPAVAPPPSVAPPIPPLPPRRPAPVVRVTLPTIAEGAPVPRPVPPPAPPPHPAPPDRALPVIGPEPPAPPPAPHPMARPPAPHPDAAKPDSPKPDDPPPFAFPKIGE
jgi:hypothetical protein